MPLRYLLNISLLLSGMVLVARTLLGPFHFILSVHSPVNAESVFGVSLAACLVLQSTREPAPREKARHEMVWLTAVVLLTVGCFARSLSFYFLSDDFALLKHAYSASPAHVKYALTTSGDGFFRPLGHMTLWLQTAWAGLDPVRWHAPSLLLHAATTLLVYLLARHLYPNSRIALWASALFAVHGSLPETVNWMASWFGVLATFFTMTALLLFLRYRERPRLPTLAASLACLVAALLAKESAYIFPLLALLLAGRPYRVGLRLTLPYWVVTALVWSYRVFVVGGIGGYKVPGSGAPQVLHLTVLGLVKAFGLRLWSVLFFPVNWSVEPRPYLVVAILVAVAALVWLTRARPNRAELIVPFGFILIPALPVAHLLLIGAGQLNARSVHLSSIGFCLLLAVAIESLDGAWMRPWIGAGLLVFQAAALQHNLTIRGDVAELAKGTCQGAAGEIAGMPGPFTVIGLPGIMNGMHFFANGFPQCIELNSGKAIPIVQFTDGGNLAGGGHTLVWDATQRKLMRR